MSTRFWMQSRGQFAEAAGLGRLAAGLLGAFSGWLVERLVLTLRFLSQLTGGALRAV